VARSPVYALFSEALDGLATIRSLVVGPMFLAEFSRRLDAFSRPYFIFFAAGRHLGFRLDFLCWLMMAATAFSSLAARDHASGVSEWLLGMSLMYVLQLASIFQWATRQSSDVENQVRFCFCRVTRCGGRGPRSRAGRVGAGLSWT
jgi:ATP-binding cassette, subfamily C (CFTR/MRP), member 1